MEALGGIGYALDTPGALFRGVLAGRPGERASGRDLLSTYGLADESDPWGGLKGFGTELITDPLALAGPALGAWKGVKGINRLSAAAREFADPATRYAVPGLEDTFRIASRREGRDLWTELLGHDDSVLGYARLGAEPGAMETRSVPRNPVFGAHIPEGTPIGRFNEIGLLDHAGFDPADWGGLQGHGFGQQLAVDALASSPLDWYYNSQASDTASAMFGRLADKGLIDLTRDMRRGIPEVEGPYITRITPEGRARAGTMGLVRGATAVPPDGSPLLRTLARFLGDEEGALRLGNAPYTPEAIRSLTGRAPGHLEFDEAQRLYRPWVDQLLPEEATSSRLFTSGPQARISHALRGASSLSGGAAIDPFAEPMYSAPLAGTPAIKAPEDVMSEVVPYLDSALSRTGAPRDLMTYRTAGQLGALKPETAESLIGATVSDPSYLSTTITPWRRFYGQSAMPRDLLLDMIVPEGGRGGYVSDLSNWEGERELLLPRDASFRVADAQRVPVEKINYEWYRLDPAGRPMIKGGHTGSPLFRDIPDGEFEDFLRQGAYGDLRMPDDWMGPNWQDYRQSRLQGEGFQTNVLLELLGGGPAPHLPAVRRLSPAEALEAIRAAVVPVPKNGMIRTQNQLKRFALNPMGKGVATGEYPDSSLLEMMYREGALRPDFDMEGLYRSFPR